MAETLILSFYPTNRYPGKGLMLLEYGLITKNYQLFRKNFTPHKKWR
ncbi:hypothetical protein [Calothrix sp. PCC 6303]|jgi:hypothetical protein|nr:hypothetical protein [Calothrix sp. PCC 6303]